MGSEPHPNGWKPRAVSFSSGGVRALSQIGVLAKLGEAGVLAEVRDWYGCSGGAITALLGVMGASTAWMRDAVEHYNTQPLGVPDPALVTNYFTTWGVNSGVLLIEYLGKFVDTWEPGLSSWTFAELAQKYPDRTLTLTATNITRGTQAVFNAARTPSVRVMDALRASMSIPLFFTPWIDASGDIYCDGAVYEYFPWKCVPNQAETLVVVTEDTSIAGRDLSVKRPITTFTDYMSQLYVVAYNAQNHLKPRNWIAINSDHVSGIDFSITGKTRLALFDSGVAAATGWLEFRQKVAAGGTGGVHPESAPPHTSARCHPSQTALSDIPPRVTCMAPTSLHPYPHLSCQARPAARRWSL
jgi:predicted acylesterase/phospholipase RssA